MFKDKFTLHFISIPISIKHLWNSHDFLKTYKSREEISPKFSAIGTNLQGEISPSLSCFQRSRVSKPTIFNVFTQTLGWKTKWNLPVKRSFLKSFFNIFICSKSVFKLSSYISIELLGPLSFLALIRA